jgi:hypothetical protein
MVKFLIGMFYLIVVAFSIVFLSMGQFRSSSGSAFDTWILNYKSYSLSIEKRETEIKQQREEFIKTWWDSYNFSENCLTLYDASSGALKSDVDQEERKEAMEAKFAKKKYEDLPPSVAKCIFRGRAMLQYDNNYYKKIKEEYEKDIQDNEALLKSDKEQYTELIKGHQEFLAFSTMENKWYTKLLFDIPYDLLVLILVVSMGLLGGIIRNLRDYGIDGVNDPSNRDYFMIPMIGGIVAIGGYTLAKTGLLLLSSMKEEASLSPFLIGLVGMVSGLLAQEVVDSIAAKGRDLLK